MTDSAPVTAAPLSLKGVWIHDPDDPAGTVKVFKYTPTEGRSSSIEIASVGHHFTGREHPVFYMSPFESFDYGVSFQIVRNDPYFPGMGNIDDMRSFMRARKPLCVRDAKGIAVTGVFQGYQESQVSHGFSVSFTVSQSHRETVTL